MPWKNTTMLEEKKEFISEYLSGNYSITDLAKAFNISRPTAYRIIKNYKLNGPKSFEKLRSTPGSFPNQTAPEIQTAIKYYRNKHKNWGARKIKVLLEREFDPILVPSATTIHSILKKNGLVVARKRFRRVKPIFPIFEAKKSNEVWSTDYKGKFLMGNKKYCHPLTICDKFSRYIFCAKGFHTENFNDTKSAFTKVFKKYGLPIQIHSDNGIPFASTRATRRFTRLSYWFIDLGIEPVFSDPASPQQNGKHERMHKDLKADCAKPAAFNMRAQQRKLNTFVKEYNNIRPHEALEMKTPNDVYEKSIRPYSDKITEWEYDEAIYPRKVTANGCLRWKSYDYIHISNSLKGKYVGLEELGNGIWRTFYRNIFLGYFDTRMLNNEVTHIKLYHDEV